MTIDIKEENGVTIVSLAGKLDGMTSDKAQEKLVPLIEGPMTIVFDMKDCQFISSAGLRVLLMIAKKLKTIGGNGAFANLSEDILDVMQMTGFDSIFANYDSLAQALQALK